MDCRTSKRGFNRLDARHHHRQARPESNRFATLRWDYHLRAGHHLAEHADRRLLAALRVKRWWPDRPHRRRRFAPVAQALLQCRDGGRDTGNSISDLEQHCWHRRNLLRAIDQLFNPPGIPPYGDPRSPDIAVAPNVGVTYSGSTAKQAEHGGFSHDDTNVMILVSNPSFAPKTLTTPVQTAQVAPTILKALGLNSGRLQAVQIQGTEVLPGVFSGKK